MISLNQDLTDSILLDFRSEDPPTIWCWYAPYKRPCTLHCKNGEVLVIMNLYDLTEARNGSVEDIIDRLVHCYLHELLHAYGGSSTATHECWLTALVYEFMDQPYWADLYKNCILDGTLVEVHQSGKETKQ